MIILAHIFYILAIVFITHECWVVGNAKRFHAEVKAMYGRKYSSYNSDEKARYLLQLIYWAWCSVGLFTEQWPAFVGLYALSIIPKGWWPVRVADAALSGGVLVFALINHFHLRIHLWNTIQSLF